MDDTLGYEELQPTRADVDALAGPTLLVFGTNWCGHCRAASRPLDAALASHPDLRVIKAEDGPGRPLGRSFRVKLWPTLIFVKDGEEVSRLVRPTKQAPISDALAELTG